MKSKIINTALNIFTALIIIAIFADCAIVFAPKIMGLGCFTTITNSMNDQINAGDLVITKPISFESIKNGDILTFTSKNKDGYFTHRVTKIDSDNKLLYTKGDNNDYDDPAPTSYEYVQGKVECTFRYLGYVKIFFSSKDGITISLGVIIVYILAESFWTYKRKKSLKSNRQL